MWDASCLGYVMHLSLLQGPPGNVILVPAVPTGGRDISWGPGACHLSLVTAPVGFSSLQTMARL